LTQYLKPRYHIYMTSRIVIILLMGCLLAYGQQCVCDVECVNESVPAETDGCGGCCHSEQTPAEDDAGSCDCMGCAESKPPVEAAGTSSPVPGLRSDPTSLSVISLTPPRERQGAPCAEVATRLPGPPAYLLFEILLT
jgi:hypothetical protein